MRILACFILIFIFSSHPDYRETAPAAASEDMYQGNVIGSVRTGLASGVPGDIRGLEYMHRRYGVSGIVITHS